MKRFVLSLLACAALLSPHHAGAQSFNHLSIGFSGGTDGFGMTLAAPLGSHVELLGGYGTSVDVLGYTAKVSVPEHPGNSGGNFVDAALRIRNSQNDGRLLFNLYPSRWSGFHFTLGAYFGSPRFLQARLSGLPDDYDQVGIGVGTYVVKASGGQLDAWMEAPGVTDRAFALKPYAGIGFGRAIRADRRVTLAFDLGAQYQGKASIWADGEGITGRKHAVELTGDALGDLGETADQILRYLVVWPTLNLHVYVRLY